MARTAPSLDAKIDEHSSLDEVKESWNQLLPRSYDNRLFLTYDWIATWRSCFPRGSLRLLEARDNDGVTGILPLILLDNDGMRELTLLGDPEVMDYMDALAVRQEAQQLLCSLWYQALRGGSWDRLLLRHIPSGSPLLPALKQAAEHLGLEVSVGEDTVCPVAILCSAWDGYLQMLTKKQRHEVRRKLRRAQDDVAWSWRTVETMQDLERDLPIFFRLHEASAAEKAVFLTEEMRDFFRAVSAVYLEKGFLRLSIFQRDGVDIASTFSFLYRDRWLLYNSGYDQGYRSSSPGIAAVVLCMQQAIAEKAVAFDFLSGDEAYKYQLGATNTYTSRAEVHRK